MHVDRELAYKINRLNVPIIGSCFIILWYSSSLLDTGTIRVDLHGEAESWQGHGSVE